MSTFPSIIQGGMGVGISNWQLAAAVSGRGQLGVVSGTGISHLLTGRLQDGDPLERMRQALAAFPFVEPVREVLDRYFVPGGRQEGTPYVAHPMYTIKPARFLDRLTALGNFVEIHLAKRGHGNPVGLNLLEKIQMPTAASLYGAMLAGVDYVLMGAGIPTQIAGLLDRLARHEPVEYRLDVAGGNATIAFDPERVFPGARETLGLLKRPKFIPIVSSVVLAQALLKRSEGEIHGFIVERPTAGGHNAPPRGKLTLSEAGEPIYGPKDDVDLAGMRALGKPFWLAGGFGRPGGLAEALAEGAAGIQVGTAFALCNESGMEPTLKAATLEWISNQPTGVVHTSPVTSPTGFPFKVVDLPATMSRPDVYAERTRLCDVGLLRTLSVTEDGRMEYRCPAEPMDDYARKGGSEDDTVGRTCLCNNLLATGGMAKPRKDGYVEAAIVTLGDETRFIRDFQEPGTLSYSASDVLDVLSADCAPASHPSV